MARQLRVYGLYQDAVDELNAAQSMDPDPGPLDLELGHDLYMLGDYELAYFHYERAAKAFPKDPKVQEMLKMLEPKLRYR
jgi:tetratricopeptide (TPR) repeat protein